MKTEAIVLSEENRDKILATKALREEELEEALAQKEEHTEEGEVAYIVIKKVDRYGVNEMFWMPCDEETFKAAFVCPDMQIINRKFVEVTEK